MNWQESIHRWRQLPEQRKLQILWEAIPDDVARSMAFEGEPVPMELLRTTLARIEPPAGYISASGFRAQGRDETSG